MKLRSRDLQLLSLAIVSGVATTASGEPMSPSPQQSVEAMETQIADLQARVKAAKIAAAKQAITDEEAAIAKARAARQYLANVNVDSSGANTVLAEQGKPSPQGNAADAVSSAIAAAKQNDVKTTITEKTDGTKEIKVERQRQLADDDDGRQKFGGIDYGLGIAWTSDLGDNKRIRDVELVDGLVRVSKSDNVRARIVLESHYLFTPQGLPFSFNRFLGLEPNEPATYRAGTNEIIKPARNSWGFGPFVALQPGTDSVIDAIGGGILLGLKRPGAGSASFNIGLGLIWDIDARVLGDGIEENKPLPGNETEVRIKTRDQKGILLMTSYSF